MGMMRNAHAAFARLEADRDAWRERALAAESALREMTTHRDYLLGRVQQTYERLRGLHDGPKGFVGHRYVCYTVSEGGTFRHCPAEFYPEIVKEGGIYETNMDDYRTPVRYVRLVEVIDDYDFTIERQRETKKGEQPPGGVHDEA